MCKFFFKLGVLSLTMGLVLNWVALFGPEMRDRATQQFVQDWYSGQPVIIENLKKWEFKNIQFNEIYVQELPQSNKIIVLGSSHTMFIRAAQLNSPSVTVQNNVTFFNHWITGINNGLEIPQHFYDLYYQRQLTPDLVILGIDPWLLQKTSENETVTLNELTVSPQKTLLRWIDNGITQISSLMMPIRTYRTQLQRIVSAKTYQFQHVFINLFPARVTVTNPMQVSHTMNRDGSFICASDVIRCQWDDIESQRETVRKGVAKNVGIFSQPMDAALQQQFEAFVRHMLSNGSKVVFVMTPLHPITYDIVKTMPNLHHIDAYYKNIATMFNIPLVGAFDPSICHMQENDFVDSDHLTDIGTAKLLSQPNCTVGPWAEVISAVRANQ